MAQSEIRECVILVRAEVESLFLLTERMVSFNHPCVAFASFATFARPDQISAGAPQMTVTELAHYSERPVQQRLSFCGTFHLGAFL